MSDFWVQNDGDQTWEIFVKVRGEIDFYLLIEPYSGYAEYAVTRLKFQRVPLEDPDDPDSIRYPPNTTIGFRNL